MLGAWAHPVCDRNVGKFETSASDLISNFVVYRSGALGVRDGHDNREGHSRIGKRFARSS